MSNWREYTLDDLCHKITDGSHQSPKAFEGGIPMYSVKDMNDHGFNTTGAKTISAQDYENLLAQGCQPEENDILIAKDGSVMKHVFRVENFEKCALLSSIAILKPKLDLVDPDFLVFSILNPNVKNNILTNYVSGSGVPRIVLKDFKKVTVNLPNLSIQKKIAEVIRNQNNKIRLNKQTNQTLEQLAQVLFKSWFVDFDPVIDNALAAGNYIPEALQHKAELRLQARQLPDFKPLPDDIRALFPSEFEQTDEPNIGISGWIPKAWRVSNIGNEFGVQGGSTPSTANPEFWDGGDIHWTSPKDLSGNDSKVLLDTSRKITEAGLAKITSGLLPLNTVLMSSRAPVGYLALAKLPVAINQGYIALLCEKELSPEYAMLFLNSIMDEIKGMSGGTTFAEISKKTFRSIKLIVPSKPAIDAFTSIAKANYDKITENIKQSISLTEIKDYLLPKLISGEIILQGICNE